VLYHINIPLKKGGEKVVLLKWNRPEDMPDEDDDVED